MARRRKGGTHDTHDTHYESTGVWPAVVTGLLLGAALVVFIAQNGHRIALEFLWLDFTTSPAVLALVSLFLAVAASVIVGAAVRHRRRKMLGEREELARLRSREATGGTDATSTTRDASADADVAP
jgi:uncharacterized integral membrane protein